MWQCPAADRRRRQRKTQNDDRRPSERVTRTDCSRRRRLVLSWRSRGRWRRDRHRGARLTLRGDGERHCSLMAQRRAWRRPERQTESTSRSAAKCPACCQQWHRGSVQPCGRPTARSADPRMTTATQSDRDSARCRRVAAAEQRGRPLVTNVYEWIAVKCWLYYFLPSAVKIPRVKTWC